MGTRLIVGAILTAFGFITIAICYLGSHNPKEPKWTGEMIMGSFIIPLAIGGLVMGPMLLGEAFFINADLITSYDITVALSILAAGTITLFLMRIPRRIAAYDALRKSAESAKPEQVRVSTNTTLGQGA